MNTESPVSTPQKCGGVAEKFGESVTEHDDTEFAARVVPLDRTRPVVEAEFVTPPRDEPSSAPTPMPFAPLASAPVVTRRFDDNVRARRRTARRALLEIFFMHQPGALIDKRDRAVALINSVDPSERDKLTELLHRIWTVATCAPADTDTR